MILEVWFCILDFGVWIFRFFNVKFENKKRKKTGRKNRLPTGGQSCFFVGPKGLGETLAIFFLTFWDVMGNPMNGTERNDKTDKTKIKKRCFLGTVSFFGGVILEVWFCILDFGVWIFRFFNVKFEKKREKKQEEKMDCLQGANPVFSLGLRA